MPDARGRAATLLSPESLGYGEIVAFLTPRLEGVRRALDVGSGFGPYALLMADRGIEVLGIDLDGAHVEAARQRAAALGLANVRFQVGDVLTAPLGKNWDLVLMSEVIEHLADDAGMLGRLHEALRPAGMLVLTTPRADAPLHRLRTALGRRDLTDERKGHLRRYTPAGLRRLLETAGFEILEVKSGLGVLVDALHNTRVGQVLLKRAGRFRTAIRAIRLLDRLLQVLSGPGDLMVAARKPEAGVVVAHPPRGVVDAPPEGGGVTRFPMSRRQMNNAQGSPSPSGPSRLPERMEDVVPQVLSALARGPMGFDQVAGAVRVPDGQVLEALLWGAERGLVGRVVLADGRVAWCRMPAPHDSPGGTRNESTAQATIVAQPAPGVIDAPPGAGAPQPRASVGAATQPPPRPLESTTDARARRLALAALIVAVVGTLANLLLNLLG